VANLVAEVTDEKSLPKQERKRLQIENAPRKSIGAQTIQLADKISNLRALATSPPVDWDERRKMEYVAWAKRVVDGFTDPNPTLKAAFDESIHRSECGLRSQSSMESEPSTQRIVNRTEEWLSAGITGVAIIGGVPPENWLRTHGYKFNRNRGDR
jgi:hypothetical protein